MGDSGMFTQIRKRDGRIVKFDSQKITEAIHNSGEETGQFNGDGEVARQLTLRVLNLAQQILTHDIPTVEEIQDIVEEVLLASPYKKTAKAYIIYRDQHAKMREIVSRASVDLMDQYLRKLDWQVNENSNMAYSLQGLNNYIFSDISKTYWLNRVYPVKVRQAHQSGDLHIHDLSLLSVYCVGWDLMDLLTVGFRGAMDKIESKPPKHFRSALGQVVNFFYTLQGEAAGAQAFSSFDTLLAPFIRYDGLTYDEVKQAMQEFVFNINVPTRVGFQCLSEDTEILTKGGWKSYQDIIEGERIYTFNVKRQKLQLKKVKSVFKKQYKGIMYRLKNQIQDQLISPGHRVVRKVFDSDTYTLEPIEDVIKLKSPFIVPIAAHNARREKKIEDEQIKLMAWIIGDGTVEHPTRPRCCYRVSIYQSEENNPGYYQEIKSLLDHFQFDYDECTSTSLGAPVNRFRLNAASSGTIHKWFVTRDNVHFIPRSLFKLSERQSRLFLDTYLKADGFEDCKIAGSDLALLDELQRMIVNAGWGITVLKRKPTIGRKSIYVLQIIKHAETSINKVEKVDYEGIIWCPNTKNETVVARRNGKVFITGNTPFTNLTMDLKVPVMYRDQPVIWGGDPMPETYGEFQGEMDMLNRAFLEVMTEGDAGGRVFTFPIPTYNITRDFNWEDPHLELLWQTTAKYGIPYFSNFVNSSMTPEDARSMCCRLRLDTRELQTRGGGLFGANPLTGSIGVVTINLPRIGYISQSEDEFLERLFKQMNLAKHSLEIKRKVLEKLTENGLYPYSRYYLRHIKQHYGQYWKNHFSTIGLVGMNEACLNLLGEDIGSERGRAFTVKVMDFMRDRLREYQDETGKIFNLEATPAEGTTYRLARVDKEKYPDIVVANEADVRKGANPFYTNSTQLPVNYTDDIFEALELQDEIQIRYTGGTVLHFFCGEQISDFRSVKTLVKKICEGYHLPYFTLTPTFSICPNHGYLAMEHQACPTCHAPCQVYSRVVGYLRPVNMWNEGKKEEFKMRKTFVVGGAT